MSQHFKIIIIGSGPAGFCAALYASRAGLSVAVFEGRQPGGQLTITTEVENYPGYEHGIMGPEMMDIFRKQAQRFGAQCFFEYIESVNFSERPFSVTSDRDNKVYTADAIIVATGATAKLLNVPGETHYMGYGVSACATCDGFFFKNQHVYVIGGGDTAMEEATYLTKHAAKVTIVHRSEEFRASKIMLERAKSNPKIDFIFNSKIVEYCGEKLPSGVPKLTSLRLVNTKTNEETSVPADGAFVAIGHQPNTQLFNNLLEMDNVGYIQTVAKSTYTNVTGVFACGDAQDSVYRQAVTAAGSGCMAALDAERWLEGH